MKPCAWRMVRVGDFLSLYENHGRLGPFIGLSEVHLLVFSISALAAIG